MTNLNGKIAVITGAAGAIGRESVRVFKDAGATVVGVDIQGESDADLFIEADLTAEDAVRDVYARAADTYGKIDVLFNNAGVAIPEDGSVLDTDAGTFSKLMEANVLSVFLCCKHGIPYLVDNGGGAVVNTASLVATMGSAASQVAYTASKGAVLSMTREIAIEFAKKNVRINAISPGPVETPLLATLFDPAQKARRLIHVPYGRFARPGEIAEAAAFLASDSASYISGHELRVDGGISSAYVTAEGEPAR
ncbi:SDR family oxidoreductase [Kribbella sp. CA-253562]|uniref:SDR family oxidoreductase n=1 Tax=Kribbella sp. CA-253562 TaxID=3239942 RepID=UPI003D903ADA